MIVNRMKSFANIPGRFLLQVSIVVLILLSMASCAKRYRTINPTTLDFHERSMPNYNLDFDYKYDLLALNGNRRLSKKERRKKFNLVAIKITNNNNFSINVRNEIQFMAQNMPIEVMPTQLLYNKLKQRSLLYALYAFVVFPVQTYPVNSSPRTILIPVGLPFAFWNVGVAIKACLLYTSDAADD